MIRRFVRELLSNWTVFRLAKRVLISLHWHVNNRIHEVVAKLPPEKVVNAGPFRGMRYPKLTSAGSELMPKIIGSYEAELHPALDACFKSQPELVVNIGCGEGYYAVGSALRLPTARVLAYDLSIEAEQKCREMAAANGVSERVQVQGACDPAALSALPASQRLLVLCDCEGAELDLLYPAHFNSAKAYDILVELHEVSGRDAEREITARFAHTHKIKVIHQTQRDASAYPLIQNWTAFEQALAMDESRAYPMTWLWLSPKN